MDYTKEREKILEVNNLKVYFKQSSFFGNKTNCVRAVNGVDFDLYKGETMALVGESACGKTTTGKAIMGLIPMTDGRVLYEGKDLAQMKYEERRMLRKDMQFIFQDPYSSLNPRMTTEQIIKRPLDIFDIGEPKSRVDRAREMMNMVGLSAEAMGRYPHEFSGGQRQRISVARSLITNPKFVIADEPTSALDVSIQCQILDLMMDLKSKLGLTMLFVSHDLSVVNYISDRALVMYVGKIVETGVTQEIFKNPYHPYSKALLEAIPSKSGIRKTEHRLSGDVSSSLNCVKGCPLATRCPYADDTCREIEPELRSMPDGRKVACHKAEEINS